MYLLKYRCPDCGTIFYAEDRQGVLKFCPYCGVDYIEKSDQELEVNKSR